MPQFRSYLLQRQQRLLREDARRLVYLSAGRYYAENKNDIEAVRCYNEAGDQSIVAELLLKFSDKHPGTGNYYALEKYFLSLPEELVEQSPQLMGALSMLHSLCFRIEESERWATKLEGLIAATPKEDLRHMRAIEEKTYLDIALPHRGSTDVKDLLVSAARQMAAGGTEVHDFSVTGNMPSVMNGGKDFTAWALHDKMLYTLLKKPAQLVLGKGTAGFADISMGESLYERSTKENFVEVLMWLNSGLLEIQARNNLQLEFAAYAVMARLFAAQNNVDLALQVMATLYDKAQANKLTMLADNIEAFRIRQSLLRGSTEQAEC